MQQQDFYQKQIAHYDQAIQTHKKKERIYSLSRLLVFFAGIIGLYVSFPNSGLFIAILFAEIVLFLFFVRRFEDAKIAHQKARIGKEINQHELAALQGDHSNFDAGLEFHDALHPYSNDLDLFREKGVFAFLNRTTSAFGKWLLSDMLLRGAKDTDQNNKIIEALSDDIAWTQRFRIAGSIQKKNNDDRKVKERWEPISLKNPGYYKIASKIIPLITITASALFYFDIIGNMTILGIVFGAMIPFSSQLKVSNDLMNRLADFENKALVSLEQIQIVKELESTHPDILALKEQIVSGEDSSYKAFSEMNSIIGMMNARMNVLVLVPLNIFLAWDMNQRLRYAKWQTKYEAKINESLELLAAFEVYISGATVLYNNRETTQFATFHTSKKITLEGLMHPLIQSKDAVSNDLSLSADKQFVILTGPNMAGKSTYLRAVGLSFVFANAGFPVFGQKVEIPRVRLFSSMRTVDDINNQSSYFHAELSRLRYIMNEIEKDANCFILLDEILKGTNSIDKEQGSKKFLSKLQRLNVQGIIATHDLALCALENENPAFVNACFDSIIAGDTLSFDYKLRAGICQNMNASFLLKQMRLVD